MDDAIRFCRTPDGVRVAYRRLGEGPPIVFPAWWYSHLEVLWELPAARAFFQGLAEHFSVVYYDKPGCGLSDRERPALALAEQVTALAALVDHLGLARLALFGFSQGGPVAAAYAAEHPERVAQLIFFSTQARTPPPAEPVQAAAIWEATKGLIRAHWGLGSSVLAEVTVPGADAPIREWFARMMRASVDAEMAITMLEHFQAVDVTPLLERIQAPTLVLQRRGDQVFPYERGRELAAAVPGTRFLPLEGSWHALYQGEDQDVLRVTRAYLDEPTIAARFAEERERPHPDGLSEREVQVLRLLAAGKSNPEIAAWLVLSPHTVVRHVSNIFTKIGVQNRVEATTYATRRGLVE